MLRPEKPDALHRVVLPATQPVVRSGPVLRLSTEGLASGVRLAKRHPELLIDIFEPNWALVDLGRAMVQQLGLDHRMSVHHASSKEIARSLHLTDAQYGLVTRKPDTTTHTCDTFI